MRWRLGIVVLAALSGGAPALAQDAANLVRNPGFEVAGGGALPDGWELYVWRPDEARVSVVEEGQRSGKRAVVITNDGDNDTRVHQSVPVHPRRSYRISCWVRTKLVGEHALGANLSLLNRPRTSEDVTGTRTEWTELHLYVRTGPGVKEVTLGLGIGGYGSLNTGAAIFDDVAVEEVAEIPFDEREELIEAPEGEGAELGDAWELLRTYDCGVIGPMGGVTHYDWDAAGAVEAAQAELRGELERVLGPRLAYASEPRFEVLFREELPSGLERTVCTVPGEAGYEILCCMLRPLEGERFPALVFAHGAGGHIVDACGFGRETYHNDCMFEIARQGYLTVTYAMRGLGTSDFGRPEWEPMLYDDIVGYTLNRGACAMNVWVYDGLQVLDALRVHEAVDPARIGFAGMSHGGQVAMYAGGLAPDRVACVVAMGSMISFDTIYGEVHNMTGHALPGIARVCDMGDLGGLVAPRPMLVQWGALERTGRHSQLRDASLRELEVTRSVYERLGAAERVVPRITPGRDHHFDVPAAIEFLDGFLR
jgi:pimeloyl-ACP methyl ester carboxylesterase